LSRLSNSQLPLQLSVSMDPCLWIVNWGQ
jgi:hypothetical protein